MEETHRKVYTTPNIRGWDDDYQKGNTTNVQRSKCIDRLTQIIAHSNLLNIKDVQAIMQVAEFLVEMSNKRKDFEEGLQLLFVEAK